MRKGQVINPVPEGTKINGYRIGEMISNNRNSFLYSATRTDGGGKLVFKYIRPESVPTALREQEIKAHEEFFNSPYIAHGFDFVRCGETCGYFMEYFSGGDLFEFVNSHAPGIPESTVSEMSLRVLHALDDMHRRGWVHRDVKLENVLLAGCNDCPDTFLCDLGLAAPLSYGESFKEPVGTPTYAAPELLLNQEYGAPVDMWAFGVMVYAMLTHAMPFVNCKHRLEQFRSDVCSGNWARNVMREVGCSKAAIDLVEQLLKVNPAERLTAEKAQEHRFFSCCGGILELKGHLTEMSEAMKVGIEYDF